MNGFDSVVDEYLSGDDRSRPWTRKQEEETLRHFTGWLRGHAPADSLDAVTPELLSRYASEHRLSDEELDDLQGALAGVRVWARRRVEAPAAEHPDNA